MSMDSMPFMNRPAPPTYSNDIRPIRSSEAIINGRTVDELATNPLNPNYRSKIPPPPCQKCGEDHLPGRPYDHEYWLDAPQASYVHSIEPPQITPPAGPTSPPAASSRVAIYVGRNDTFVVAVESAPDWDVSESFKVGEDRVLDMVRLARALQIKVVDKTGGELSSLSMHASEPA